MAVSDARCEHCRGRVGQYADGRAGGWGIHRKRGCPGEAQHPQYEPRPITLETLFTSYQDAFERLSANAVEHGLDALARWEWPACYYGIIIATHSIRWQLELLGRRVRSECGSLGDQAEQLAQAIDTVLHQAPRGPLGEGFTAPSQRKIARPPWSIHLRIERLRDAGALPITSDTLERTDALGLDARMVQFWLNGLAD